jgi:hypothetical protein
MNYVSCDIMGHLGRLGNQMFQYAFLIAYNNKHGNIPLINRNRKQMTGGDPLHKMVIDDCFDLTAEDINNHVGLSMQRKRESTHHYNPSFDMVQGNLDVVGYFQDERYFKECSDVIRKEFTFKKEIQEQCDDIMKEFKKETVSVHIRRTDYLSLSEHHPIPSMSYFKKCMEEFSSDVTYLIFSDDVQWCKENFIGNNMIIQENNHFVDLCLMTMCDHNIITNSSFSWWGAWLNPNPNKKVFFPSEWFGPAASLNYRNGSGEFSMCPSNWICVEY